MTDIFLSYNREDQARAKLFAEAFEAQGFKVWWDVGLRAGEASRRDADLAARTGVELKKLAEAGIMRPHISHRLPLEQTREALLVLERREAIGRVVISIDKQ